MGRHQPRTSLGQTPAQQAAYDQMTAAKASEGQYDFNEENSVDPVGHWDGETVSTKTRDETLGQTMYKVSSEEGSTDSQEERNLFSHGYEDEEDTGSGRRLQMDVVHQNEPQLAGVMTPKSILKKTKFAAKDTPTEGETQEGGGDQINLARMSLAVPTDANHHNHYSNPTRRGHIGPARGQRQRHCLSDQGAFRRLLDVWIWEEGLLQQEPAESPRVQTSK
jgi:hypothetical protein